ncbi:MAG: hypothetical protein IPH82_12020 [Chloroflexi bacterium]|nr:hypothetical protein [Chloroflexota bacterium]
MYLVDTSNEEYELIRNKDVYEEKPLLDELDADFFGLSIEEAERTNWRLLEGFDVEAEYMSSYVWDLTVAVLTQSDPDIANKITDLLAYLPPDDPEAQPYIEHLTCLLGYHYELSGDDETAVTTYLSLIRQAPSSPWSWLAWARLEPVE